LLCLAGSVCPRNVNGDIKYYITDHLHSTAMFVDKTGTTAAVLDDNDFYPWGGVVPGVGKTTSNNHYKMTGKERDTESGLDYYGGRYYGSSMGRFMSPDWAAKPATVPYAEFGDPQSLNLYSYTRNSPIIRVDGDGHDANGMLARPGQAGILGAGNGGLATTMGGDFVTETRSVNVTNPNGSTVTISNTVTYQQGTQSNMSLSTKGLKFIECHEAAGCKPNLTAYDASGNKHQGDWTIGYGHKILPGENFSNAITEAQAEALLSKDVQKAVNVVNGSLNHSPTQSQFDAMVSLAFNIGGGAFQSSTLVRELNHGGKIIEDYFTRWNKTGGSFSQGLFNRREDEWKVFSTGQYP
jgi:RHS repeat-associated protein